MRAVGKRITRYVLAGCWLFEEGCSVSRESFGGVGVPVGFDRILTVDDRPGCFFFWLRPRGKAREGEAPLEAGTGPEQKKNTTQGVFFLLRPRPDRGGVFFFAVAPPGRSLTHGGLGRFRQGPGGVFFLLRPRRVFLENSIFKKSLGYYIGSKKTRRGHSKKKKHHFLDDINPALPS